MVISTVGPASVHVLVESANKRLSENLGIAGRKQGGILGAHLPFMGDANCHQQLIPLLSSYGATQQVFLPTLPHFLPSVVIYHLLKPLSCFSFSPVRALGSLSSSHVQVGGKGCCCCSLWLQGGILCPAPGRWSR